MTTVKIFVDVLLTFLKTNLAYIDNEHDFGICVTCGERNVVASQELNDFSSI